MGRAAVVEHARGEWVDTDPLPQARAWWGHSDGLVRLVDGMVLAIGGEDSRRTARAEVGLYDPVSGRWELLAPLATPRRRNSATVLADGRVLVAGGLTGPREFPATGLADAELYDPATDTWTPAGRLAEPRFFHSASLLPDGRVLVIGGSTTRAGGYTMLATAELYDPELNSWTRTEHYDAGAGRRSLAQEEQVGRTGDRAVPLGSGEVLVVGSGRRAALRVPRAHFGVVELHGGDILVVGGVTTPVGDPTPVCGGFPLTDSAMRFRPGP
ncbi:hypothetical protein JOF53_001635 [Crossiella equi]|uniref:N-acetylneuraminate epimerase n=1 Tax=Crossiella equi TaxID=130796 RepID=A0ABS5A837_9PSEU|nr:kelch repeat-containing protein [Crossiella equi]MBP2472763.1 hypothetical protein [Crossiella equi]